MVSLYLPKGELRAQLINEHSYRAGLSGRASFYAPAYVTLLFMLYRMHRLGLREFAGFMLDYWRERRIDLPVPSFGHLSDLFAELDIAVRKKCTRAAQRLNEGEPVTVIVDSTGLRNFGSSWNILDVPGQFAGNKKPAEPIAVRVSVYFSELLQTTSDIACETVWWC
jgi:hypothetical protein